MHAGEEEETWEGQQHKKGRGAEIALEEVHSQNNIAFPALLLAAKGLPLPPIG